MDVQRRYFGHFNFIILITVINLALCNAAVNRLLRQKRFLVEDRFSQVTSCCVCDDFTDKKCASVCQASHDLCFLPNICTITVHVINGIKYKKSGCGAKSNCIYDSQKTFYDNEPCDGLRVNELHNGTKCAYCCQGLNPVIYHDPAYCVDGEHWTNADDLELLGGVIMTKSTTQTVPSTLRTTVATTDPRMVRCDMCEYNQHCSPAYCSKDETYCMNVVQFDEFGNRTVIKKTCANYLECEFDHSKQGCGIEARDQTCQFCCLATNDSKTCNADTIPSNIEWFGDTTSTTTSTSTSTTPTTTTSTTTTSTSTTTSTTPTSTPTTSTSTTTTPTTSSSTTTPTTPTSTTTTSTSTTASSTATTTTISTTTPTTVSSTETTNPATASSTSRQTTSSRSPSSHTATTTSVPLFTKAPKTTTSNTDTTVKTSATPLSVKTTTRKSPHTLPPVPITCETCIASTDVCDVAFQPTTCEPPFNYCINKVVNFQNGLREVNRTCGDFNTCYRDWFLGSSDNDKCRYFDENNIVTLDFTCTFCCTKDECNKPMRPNDDTLYTDF